MVPGVPPHLRCPAQTIVQSQETQARAGKQKKEQTQVLQCHSTGLQRFGTLDCVTNCRAHLIARGSEWMYVRTYVPEYVTLRNVDSGFPAGELIAARARRCENYNLEKQISGRARGAPGPSTAGAATNSYIWSHTVDFCLYQ